MDASHWKVNERGMIGCNHKPTYKITVEITFADDDEKQVEKTTKEIDACLFRIKYLAEHVQNYSLTLHKKIVDTTLQKPQVHYL